MENFHLLGQLAVRLHEEFRNTYYLLLPIFFGISIALGWFRNPAGGPDFIETLKRSLVATLLLVGFTEITDAILTVTQGLALKISDMSGIDQILEMAGEKAKSYTLSPGSMLTAFNDLVMATLSFLSFLILYVTRYLMLAIYHFTWMFLTMMAPILLLFHLFTSQITLNLFKSLIEVASWQIVWASLSAMLKALPFGNAYSVEGDYLIVILINIVVALAILGTPLIVRSLVGSGFSAVAGSLGPASVATMMALPARSLSAVQFGRELIKDNTVFFRAKAASVGGRIGERIRKYQASRPIKPPRYTQQRPNPGDSHVSPMPRMH